MTTYKGNSGVVMVGANTIAEVTAFTIEEAAERIEDTSLGDSARTYQAGSADITGTIDCWWDTTDTNGQQAMTVGASVTLVLRPRGTASGYPTRTISAYITSIGTDVAFDQIIKRTFSWVNAGGSVPAWTTQ